MGVLGGILLLVAVVLFFFGLVPFALFIGVIGLFFAITAACNGDEGGAAKGFGCGCLVIIGIVGVASWFLYKVVTADGSGSHKTGTAPAKREKAYTTTSRVRKYSGKRKSIKEFIDEQGGCRIAAITKKGGDVAISGDNGCAWTGACPSGLSNVLKEINEARHKITDICLTDAGRYVVLYGRNGFYRQGIPQRMYNALHEYNGNKEELYCATLNDVGDWVVISDKHFSCSSTEILNWLENGQREFGDLQYVTLTDDARVAIFEKGRSWYGNYPEDLREATKKSTLDPCIIKMAGDSWFFANEAGCYSYNM